MEHPPAEQPPPRGYGFNPHQLTRIRRERRMSQRQLSAATGLARMGIVKYEKGVSEPRIESVQLMAKELGVAPHCFYDWTLDKTARQLEIERMEGLPEGGPELNAKPSTVAPDRSPASDPIQAFGQNLAMLSRLDLRALQSLLDTLTNSENPLDYDAELHDRELAELQQVSPEALKEARSELSLSLYDVSQFSGLPLARLTEIEAVRGMPIQPHEIMALRRTLGVKFEPRAVTTRNAVIFTTRDRRSPKAKLAASVHAWQEQCQRTPNKLDSLLRQLQEWNERIARMEERLEKSMKSIKSEIRMNRH